MCDEDFEDEDKLREMYEKSQALRGNSTKRSSFIRNSCKK